LRFAQDHRVETGGDFKQVRRCFAIASDVDEAGGVAAESIGEECRYARDRVIVLFDGVDLGAVARRYHDSFSDQPISTEASQDVQCLPRPERELLTNIDRRRGVAHANYDHRHDFTFSLNDPSSTESQKSSPRSWGAAVFHLASPPAISRNLSPRN